MSRPTDPRGRAAPGQDPAHPDDLSQVESPFDPFPPGLDHAAGADTFRRARLDTDISEVLDDPSEIEDPDVAERAPSFAGLLAIPDVPTTFEVQVVASSALEPRGAHDSSLPREDRRVDLPASPSTGRTPTNPAREDDTSDPLTLALSGAPDELSEEVPFSIAQRAAGPELDRAAVRMPRPTPSLTPGVGAALIGGGAIAAGAAAAASLGGGLNRGTGDAGVESPSGLRPRARSLTALRQQPASPEPPPLAPSPSPPSPGPARARPGLPAAEPLGVAPDLPDSPSGVYRSPLRAGELPAEPSGVHPIPTRPAPPEPPPVERRTMPPLFPGISAESRGAPRAELPQERSGARPALRPDAAAPVAPPRAPPVVASPTSPTRSNPPVAASPTRSNPPVAASPTRSNPPVAASPTRSNPPVAAGPTRSDPPPRPDGLPRSSLPPTLPAWQDAVRTPVGTRRPVLAPPVQAEVPRRRAVGLALLGGAALGAVLLVAVSMVTTLNLFGEPETVAPDPVAPPAARAAAAPPAGDVAVAAASTTPEAAGATPASGVLSSVAPVSAAAGTPPGPQGAALPPPDRQWEVHFALNHVEPIDAGAPPAWLQSCARITVTGHACALGSTEINAALGLARAESVRSLLTQAGVDPARVSLRSVGSAAPEASDASESGRRRNRRAVVQCEGG